MRCNVTAMLDTGLPGRTFPAPAPFTVTEERVAAFATATGTPYTEGGPAPATFPITVMFECLGQLIVDPSVGLDLSRIVHGAQKFAHQRPVVAGDVLTGEMTVKNVRSSAGLDIISTTTAITDAAGEPVCTCEATLIHRGAA